MYRRNNVRKVLDGRIETYQVIDIKGKEYKDGISRISKPKTNEPIEMARYRLGHLTGVRTIYHNNELKISSIQRPKTILNYRNGLLSGQCISYYTDGHIKASAYFTGGKPTGQAIFFDKFSDIKFIAKFSCKGTKCTITNFKNNIPDEKSVKLTIDEIDDLLSIFKE